MKTILAYLVLLTSIDARPGRAHNNDHEALGVALKYIPDDVAHHYNFQDPKKKWEPTHNITAADLKPQKRDVTRIKFEEDIPRVAEKDYSEEEIPHEEHMINIDHYEHAQVEHHQAVRQRRIAHEKEVKSDPDYNDSDEQPEFEPEIGFSVEFVYAMVFKVHFRDRYMKKPDDDLVSNAITIERDLYNQEINYQSIAIKEDTQSVQILCNDPEERDHLKHMLLASNMVLAFENNHRRWYSKFTKDDEKEKFKHMQMTFKKEQIENGHYTDDHHDENLRKIKEHEYFYDKHINGQADDL